MFNVGSTGMFNQVPSVPKPQEYGTIYNQSLWPDFSNWTATGFTPTVSGGQLQIIGATSFGRFLTHNYGATLLSKWERVTNIVVPTIDGTSKTMGIGIKDTGARNPRGCYWDLLVVNTASNGSIRCFTGSGTSYSLKQTGANKLTVASGDRVQFRLKRTDWQYVFTVTNLTNPNSVTLTINVTPTDTTTVINWIGKFSIWVFAGTWLVDSDLCTSEEFKYPRAVFTGDSKTEGWSATTILKSYPYLIYDGQNNKTLLGKGESRTDDLLTAMQEIINFSPKIVFLAVGSNDLRSGIATATWQSRYLSIRNQLVAAGFRVIHLRPFKESVLDQSTLDAYVKTFVNDIVVDTYTNFNTSTMLNADGIHPNDVGMAFIAAQIGAQVSQFP